LVLERKPDDPALIAGYARLVDHAVQQGRQELARHLRESGTKLPASLQALVSTLERTASGR
jgi:hypothetical protein